MTIKTSNVSMVFAGLILVFLEGLFLSGCTPGTTGGGGPPPPPSITLKRVAAYYPSDSALNLPYAIAGQAAFTLLANGTGFTTSSVVEWNGTALPTTFGDSSDLSASISSSLISAPGNATITVQDSSAASNALVLPIASPATATAGVVALVTAASDATPANGDSLVTPSISATGRYVAFQSNATNLAPGPASGYQEIYERDTCIGAPPGCTPSTTHVTVTYDGSPVNGHSLVSAISADGRYVAFDSSATNVLPNSTICGSQPGLSCLFMRDTCVGAPSGCAPATFAVSIDTGGAIAPGSGPILTPDGRFVTFGSSSSRLGLGNGTVGDVFLRDTCLGVPSGCNPSTTQVSFSSVGASGNATSQLQALSATGRFVAYISWATNMVPNETVVPGWFWRDTCLGAPSGCTPNTVRGDVTDNGAQPNDGAFIGAFPAMTADGRLVAFGSGATNLVSTDVGGQGNVYTRDTCTGAAAGCTPSTSLVSRANDGSAANCGSPGYQGEVSMLADGRFVAFGSIATNLTPDDTFPACGWEDIFVRDTCFGVTGACTPSTVRVSVANTPNPGISGNAPSAGNAMSADGHYVVFISAATNFLQGVTGNGHAMVYLAKTGF